MTLLSAIAALACAAAALPQWTFEADTQGWTPNTHLADVRVEDGLLKCRATDWDPMFVRGDVDFPATACQFVKLNIQATRDGQGELFWTGRTDGPHGGFSQDKSTRFDVKAGEMQTITLYPFWHSEGAIRQLRLDLFGDSEFAIKSISIGAWAENDKPATDVYEWTFEQGKNTWRSDTSSSLTLSPPLDLSVQNKAWAYVGIQSPQDGVAQLIWATPGVAGPQSESFPISRSGETRFYNVELHGNKSWGKNILALGLRLPAGASATSLKLAESPEGPGELTAKYIGFEDALTRAGQNARVLVQFTNTGGKPTEPTAARLVLPADMTFVDSAMEQPVPALARGDLHEARWTVKAAKPGDYNVLLGYGKAQTAETPLSFDAAPQAACADYVPEPKPVFSPFDICAYYFPGWDSHSKWECIRTTAPNRKPALGYYDEGNPEVVDWQIKWAVENGISCFLVDWYWSEGHQHLTHWFEAYRKARYRDMLKVAIMWANHNAPNTHSAEDFRNVTREWIDKYFNLPAYYRINGKPAVFIWAPSNIRADLKGSEAVKQSLDEAQQMAIDAGYPGITFVAMGYDFSKAGIDALLAEGYHGVTTYHEWGDAMNKQGPERVSYEEVVKTSAKAWNERNKAAGALTYYPVVDTGWDSRPWHGDKSFVIDGRTPDLFHNLLQTAWQFAVQNDKKIVVLGPLNEWGEGSYIEPCVEYGFKMYEAVRSVFAQDAPPPANVAPADLGMGPYDFPVPEPRSNWQFDSADSGWKAMMGVSEPAVADGKLVFDTTSSDPAIMATSGARASEFTKAVITMKIDGEVPEKAAGQLFWSADARQITGDTSVSFPLQRDGQMHTYTLPLADNPRWRGRINTLRLDPCNLKNVKVTVEEIKLLP